jgi:hypothetical protein
LRRIRIRRDHQAGVSASDIKLTLLAWTIMPVYLEVVSSLESIVEDLKSLPPTRLEVAADFVHRLKRISEQERQAILTRTAGALSLEEADELERVIEEGCEQIDENGW